MEDRRSGGGTPVLRGRSAESDLLDGIVAAVRQGESRTVLLLGDAGVGKTALLRYLLDAASDLQIARAVGVESEMELAFAGLHQLCAPMLEHVDRLPAPQRDGLKIVFGLSEGPAPDRFLVGLGVLSLLSEVAGERPLICVVDDAQWLDQASAHALAFVARRLFAEPVGLVFAARQAGDELGGLPELKIRGLPEEDARVLLAEATPGRLDDGVRDRIVAETRGNPLALLELPRSMSAAELAGGFELPAATDLPGHMEDHYRRRVYALPDATQQLMLLAAADPVGDVTLLWRAAEKLGLGTSALGPATDAELVQVGARVQFHHPLVRSAVQRSSGVEERRATHLALAEATDPEVDPDRRAWHLAAATSGPDEDVALELERSASRARARGGLAAAAAFLERAVALSDDPMRRAERALAAAEASLGAGNFDAARGLLAVAEAAELDELQRARLDLLRAEASYSESRGSDAPGLLLRAAKTLEPLDAKLARETYLDAWSSALFAGSLASSASMREISEESRSARIGGEERRPSDLLLDGFALAFTDGRSAAAPVLELAASRFAGDEVATDEVLRWGWLATAAAVMVWDYDTCLAVATRGVEVAREAGALTVLGVSLNVMAQAMALGGQFERAATLVGEADIVTEATGARVAPYGALVLAGLQDGAGDPSALMRGAIEEFTAGGQGTAVQYAHWAHSILLNGLGRYPQARVAAKKASDDTPELFVSVWAAIELLEAATRGDETDVAREALERINAATAVASTDWALGIQARSRALVSKGELAGGLYQDAIEHLGRTGLGPETARTHLLYGEWLRRENRRVDARQQLRIAHDRFTAIGMEAFAERARGELLATGEKVRKRTVETRDELTPQEHRIARLARDGLSNPEIGARLFLSPRTVEWHLRKVFTKLGIRSRRELANALPSSESKLTPA